MIKLHFAPGNVETYVKGTDPTYSATDSTYRKSNRIWYLNLPLLTHVPMGRCGKCTHIRGLSEQSRMVVMWVPPSRHHYLTPPPQNLQHHILMN